MMEIPIRRVALITDRVIAINIYCGNSYEAIHNDPLNNTTFERIATIHRRCGDSIKVSQVTKSDRLPYYVYHTDKNGDNIGTYNVDEVYDCDKDGLIKKEAD